MLVDHLTDVVLEKHHKLVKGLNLALEFNAVHQENGDGDALLSKGVKKGVLKVLPFRHGRISEFF